MPLAFCGRRRQPIRVHSWLHNTFSGCSFFVASFSSLCGKPCFYLFFLLGVHSRKADDAVASKCQGPVLSICLARQHQGLGTSPNRQKCILCFCQMRKNRRRFFDSAVLRSKWRERASQPWTRAARLNFELWTNNLFIINKLKSPLGDLGVTLNFELWTLNKIQETI